MITSLSVFVFNLEAEEEEITSIIFQFSRIYISNLFKHLKEKKRNKNREKYSDNRVLQQQQQKNISSPTIFDF